VCAAAAQDPVRAGPGTGQTVDRVVLTAALDAPRNDGQAGELGDGGVGAVSQPPMQSRPGAGTVGSVVDQPEVVGGDPGAGGPLDVGVAGVQVLASPTRPTKFDDAAAVVTVLVPRPPPLGSARRRLSAARDHR
jgi:hypothetical protein